MSECVLLLHIIFLVFQRAVDRPVENKMIKANLITTETQLKKPAYMQHHDIVCIYVIRSLRYLERM